MAPRVPVISSVFVFVVTVDNCGVVAQPPSIWAVSLVGVGGGLWFGSGPESHDVYFKLKRCGFQLFHIIRSVS